jgi:gas vesicle protein
MSDQDGGGVGILWFLAGMGVGALMGVLYAPRSGDETRDVIRNKAGEGREYVRGRVQDARERASDWMDRGREVMSQQKEQFRSAFEAGRQAYQEATSDTAAPKNL